MVARQHTPTLRRRLFVAALGVVVAGGIGAAVLVTRSPTQGPETAGRPGRHSASRARSRRTPIGSWGTTSAPQVTDHPGIRLIPSAGGPVSAYGGAPSASTFLPAQKKG